MMNGTKVRQFCATVLLATVASALAGSAVRADDDDDKDNRPLTIGVIGDMPYTAQQFAAFQGFLNTMSADGRFKLTVHLGDIKAGSTACTDPYINGLRDALDSYAGALVYTPGDNEWTDCHRNAADPRNPAERLTFIRGKFFYRPGATLGVRPRRVVSQGSEPGFSDFVENQAWVESKTVFGVLNLPGSNNDLDPWTHNVAPRPSSRRSSTRGSPPTLPGSVGCSNWPARAMPARSCWASKPTCGTRRPGPPS
jgi:hypothetical protein